MSSQSHTETYRRAFPNEDIPHISYGLPFAVACQKHIKDTFKALRIYIIASKTLSANTSALQDLKDALGSKVVGVRLGMTPHTLWSECLEVTAECKRLDVDLIITLGAGSLTDAAKIVSLALANNASTPSDLSALESGTDWTSPRPHIQRSTIPIISIPTTLSGGEYQALAGGTNDSTHQKHGFNHGTVGPSLVILDAGLTASTPDKYWLSTGVRAVDHCVETLCSLHSHDEGDAAAEKGLKLLVPALLACKQSKEDLEARHRCQLGVIHAMAAVKSGVDLGASHGIGHQLGPLGVGHGETSCILLPSVCRYNAKVNKDRQRHVEEILWADNTLGSTFAKQNLKKGEADLGDLLDTFISALGMPRTLKAVGIGQDKLDLLAEKSLNDKWCHTNPFPLKKKAQVLKILETVVG